MKLKRELHRLKFSSPFLSLNLSSPGLGTSTSKEAKEYFQDMERHRIKFNYTGQLDDGAITLAFSKKQVDDRKEWLTDWMVEGRRRKELNLPEVYLYEKDTKAVNYQDFVNKELVLFSNMDNERSIPCLVDGFKPGQRKVWFTCLKRNLVKELKVAQLAGSVSEKSAYHHGEASLMGTIIGLAQNFVGSQQYQPAAADRAVRHQADGRQGQRLAQVHYTMH